MNTMFDDENESTDIFKEHPDDTNFMMEQLLTQNIDDIIGREMPLIKYTYGFKAVKKHFLRTGEIPVYVIDQSYMEHCEVKNLLEKWG